MKLLIVMMMMGLDGVVRGGNKIVNMKKENSCCKKKRLELWKCKMRNGEKKLSYEEISFIDSADVERELILWMRRGVKLWRFWNFSENSYKFGFSLKFFNGFNIFEILELMLIENWNFSLEGCEIMKVLKFYWFLEI